MFEWCFLTTFGKGWQRSDNGHGNVSVFSWLDVFFI